MVIPMIETLMGGMETLQNRADSPILLKNAIFRGLTVLRHYYERTDDTQPVRLALRMYLNPNYRSSCS